MGDHSKFDNNDSLVLISKGCGSSFHCGLFLKILNRVVRKIILGHICCAATYQCGLFFHWETIADPGL